MTLDWLTYFPSPARGVWHLGPVPIRAYALCIIIGIVIALLLGDRRWRARGGEPGVIYDIALWAVPFGLIGGRLYHLMTDWRTYFGAGGVGWEATPRIWDGGLGIWGAVALGGVGAWIGCRRHGISLPAFGDAVAPGIVLAQAIGRVGNYFNQELYGRETTLPWGLEIFWREDAAGIRDPHLLDGVSTGELYKIVQPTFLYELLWNVAVFLVLIYVDRRFRIGHGRLFALYVAGYCIGRFGIELLRDDAATHIAGIRVNSFTSTFVFIGAVVYILLAAKGREDPEEIRRAWQTDVPSEADDDSAESEVLPADEASPDEAQHEPDSPAADEDTAAADPQSEVVDQAEETGEADAETVETEPDADDEVADEEGAEDEVADTDDDNVAAVSDGDSPTDSGDDDTPAQGDGPQDTVPGDDDDANDDDAHDAALDQPESARSEPEPEPEPGSDESEQTDSDDADETAEPHPADDAEQV